MEKEKRDSKVGEDLAIGEAHGSQNTWKEKRLWWGDVLVRGRGMGIDPINHESTGA